MESTASYLPVDDVLSEDDLFLEGLQLVASEGLWEGLSCAGSVPGGGENSIIQSRPHYREGLVSYDHLACLGEQQNISIRGTASSPCGTDNTLSISRAQF